MLAPLIVESIRAGQGVSLSAERLKDHARLHESSRIGADFDHSRVNCGGRKARWRMRQSDANCSLRQISLIIRENTGNIRDFGQLGVELRPNKPGLLSGFCRSSLLNRT